MFGLSLGSSESGSQSTGYSLSSSNSASSDLPQSIERSAGQSASTQQIAYDDLFRALYSGAGGAAGQAAALVPTLQAQTGALFSGGLSTLQELGGGAGADYLTGRLTGDNGALDAQ